MRNNIKEVGLTVLFSHCQRNFLLQQMETDVADVETHRQIIHVYMQTHA